MGFDASMYGGAISSDAEDSELDTTHLTSMLIKKVVRV